MPRARSIPAVNRRAFLALATGAAGLAGCTGPASRRPTSTSGGSHEAPLARRGTPADVCERDVVDLGIAAIVEPAFGGARSDDEVRLDDDEVVVGVERDGRARAFPLSVLARAEVVNETFPGGSGGATPLLVTYCPVCDSGMVARRLVDGEPTTFGVSGQVWEPPGDLLRGSERDGRVFAVAPDDPGDDRRVARDGALVLYDAATGSYWSQVLARAICGPRRGATLTPVPSTTARWGRWRRRHPDTDVLLPFPASGAANPPIPGGETATPREPL